MFSSLRPSDLVLLDRGYPAFWLFKAIEKIGANFCARINRKWAIVNNFIASGQQEQIIQLNATPTSIATCRQMELDIEPITVRLIRIELNTGEIEVLITTLIDGDIYPHDIFADLYHKRWPVEEDYKYMKYWLEIANLTGKSVHSVYQDFYAKIFSKNLTSVLGFPTRTELKKAGKIKKFEYQINFVEALSTCKNVIALLFLKTQEKVIELIKDLRQAFEEAVTPIRPDRVYPRNHEVLKRKFIIVPNQLLKFLPLPLRLPEDEMPKYQVVFVQTLSISGDTQTPSPLEREEGGPPVNGGEREGLG